MFLKIRKCIKNRNIYIVIILCIITMSLLISIKIKKDTFKLLEKAKANCLNKNPHIKSTYNNILNIVLKKYLESGKNG